MKLKRRPKSAINKVGASAVSLALALGACDSSDEQLRAVELGGKCTLNSDCTGKLVCIFEHCHAECDEDEDCKLTGGRCVRVPHGEAEKATTVGVCQLDADSDCAIDDDCKGKQVCAADRQCRD